MLKELVEKADKLEQQGGLIPIGYDVYSDSVKWVVHLYPDEDRIHIEEYAVLNRPRPMITRTRNKFAYPFADESAYVLGVDLQKDGSIDVEAAKKHNNYLDLLEEISSSPRFADVLLREASNYILTRIKSGCIKNAFTEKIIYNKDWVSFVYEKGYLKDKHLYDLPETKALWAGVVLKKICGDINGQCCICGKENIGIVKNIPTSVKLMGSRRQIASLNDNSFVSFRYVEKDASLGICPLCAEKSSKALSMLLEKSYSIIYVDKALSGKINNDSCRNQISTYWLREDMDLSIGEYDVNLIDIIKSPLELSEEMPVETTEKLINHFLKSPWTAREDTVNIDENSFYVAILSPNGPGRIAVRDWVQATAGNIKYNLYRYFAALKLVNVRGEVVRPYTITQLLEPLPDVEPNMVKSLIRCAYLGEYPPVNLFQSAVRRIRVLSAKTANKRSDKEKVYEVWQRLCTIIKLYLSYGEEEPEKMESLDKERNNVAYHLGRLLAVLEQIQRRAATGDLSSTLVNRYYGSASTSPVTVFPTLINMATKAHMPKVRKKNLDYKELEELLEEIMAKIDGERRDNKSGFPSMLLLSEQGEFALGFYHQRAEFRKQTESRLNKN